MIANRETLNRWIAGDVCRCGHRRLAHDDTVTVGHGACMNVNCDCGKFTWAKNDSGIVREVVAS